MSLSKKKRREARLRADEQKLKRSAHRKAQESQKVNQARDVYTALKNYSDRAYKTAPGGSLGYFVAQKAPRLMLSTDYANAVARMSRADSFVRPFDSWIPKGRGRETQFRSLADHLYAKYPMPPFLWSAFFDNEPSNQLSLIPLVIRLASGMSFADEVKHRRFSVPLTRKMCHEVLRSSSDVGFLDAIRRVQVQSAGGDLGLWKAWIRTPKGRLLGSADDEAFWATVIAWLAKNPMLDRVQVGPWLTTSPFAGDKTLTSR